MDESSYTLFATKLAFMFAIVGRSCYISSYKVARKPLSVAGLFDSKDRIMTKPMLQPSFVAGPLESLRRPTPW